MDLFQIGNLRFMTSFTKWFLVSKIEFFSGKLRHIVIFFFLKKKRKKKDESNCETPGVKRIWFNSKV